MSEASSVGVSCWRRVFPSGYLRTLRQMAILSWPIALTHLSMMMFTFISIPFLGRLGKDELSALGIATAIIQVFGNATLIGLFTACETLVSQANGRGELKRIGVICQQSLWVGFVTCAPIVAVVLNVENLFRFFKVSDPVSGYVETYIYIYLIVFPLNVLYMMLMKFLQCQLVVIPVVVLCVLANVFNVLMHYILIVQLSMGVAGAATSVAATTFLFVVFLFIYIVCRRLHVGIWNGLSRKAFVSWGGYLRLAIPGIIMVCLQFWSFEIGMIACVFVDETNLATNVIIVQILGFCFVFFGGIATATCIYIGNELGRGEIDSAKTAANVSFTISLAIGTFFGLLLLALNNPLPYFFTSMTDVVLLTQTVMPICAIFQLGDAVTNVSNGVIRGCGRQKIGAILNFVAYYLISLPLGLTLLSPRVGHLGVMGFWIGQLVAQYFMSTVLLVYQFRCINWKEEKRLARERLAVGPDGGGDGGGGGAVKRGASAAAPAAASGRTTPAPGEGPVVVAGSATRLNDDEDDDDDVPELNGGEAASAGDDDCRLDAQVARRATFICFFVCGFLLLGFVGHHFGRKAINEYLGRKDG